MLNMELISLQEIFGKFVIQKIILDPYLPTNMKIKPGNIKILIIKHLIINTR